MCKNNNVFCEDINTDETITVANASIVRDILVIKQTPRVSIVPTFITETEMEVLIKYICTE